MLLVSEFPGCGDLPHMHLMPGYRAAWE